MLSMARSRPFTGHCSHRLADTAIHHPYVLRELTGAMVRYCLGCGANGCAFRADDSLVLKLSAHDGESPIADIVAGHGRIWPFLPIFYGSWIVPGADFGRKHSIGITLREDLIDFSPDHPKDFVRRASDFLDQATGISHSPERVQTARRNLTRVFREMTTFDAMALRMIADFAVWSSHYGLGFDLEEFSGSLAITNLGQSLEDDAVVIRDLGNFDPTNGALQALRRATQQRARDQKRGS
jgi:hypothetical protein